MADWVKAPEVQLELHRWFTSDVGRTWTRGWVAAERRAERLKGDTYGMALATEPQKLLTADAIWVAEEMSEIISYAREGFQPEPMEREDFIVHTGFVYFEKPLHMLDRNGMTVSLGAISWCPLRVTGKGEHEVFAEDYADLKRETTNGTEAILYGSEVTEDKWGMLLGLYSSASDPEDSFHESHQGMRKEMGAPELIPLHFVDVMFGDPLGGHLTDEHGRTTGADQWWKTVQTTLRMMQQRVFERADEPTPRATRRRWEREGKSAPKEICVVRLRRAKHKTGEPVESGRTLTHRHIRDGHWRWQFYPSVNRHRQIWIAQTVVGDESLPLIVKKRYYKWDR